MSVDNAGYVGQGYPTDDVRSRLIHIGDTLNPVQPSQLPGRLQAAGLVETQVDCSHNSLRFRARRPL